MQIVENAGTVLTRSYTVLLAVASLVLYVADHMNMLDFLPLEEHHRNILHGVLLALIPLARILKQKSISPQPVLKE